MERLISTRTASSEEPRVPESQPWTFFYRAGEVIRGLRKTSKKDGRAEAVTCSENLIRDERAAQRMLDEGCPNDPMVARPHEAEYGGIGGRLLLVGSPIF